MTLQERMALMSAAIWAMLWYQVGRQFGNWYAAGAAAGGGFAGLILGWLLIEWKERMRPHTNWPRTIAEISGFVLAWTAFLAIPLCALSLVRAR